MIPLLIPAAVGLASDVVDAWKQHAANTAAAQTVNGPAFQQALKTATAQAAAMQQQAVTQALPGELQSVTQQLLKTPDVQSIARSGTSGSVNLQFDGSGNVSATQVGGGSRSIVVSADLKAQLQQLNSEMHSAAGAAYHGVAHMSAKIASNNMPVQLNLMAA
jgi:predicted membrane-bound mannosyltransferase